MTVQARPAVPVIDRGRAVLARLPTASTTPARLLRLGLVLVLACLVTAVVSAASGLGRQSAMSEAAGRVSVLSGDATELYHSLADADAMATSGYVAGGVEPAAVRGQYEADLARASDRLVHAAELLPPDDPGQALLATVSREVPEYSGSIETARFYNRQGLPLGETYLATGSQHMREVVLPAVERLRRMQATTLADEYRRAAAIPLAVVLLTVAALIGLLGTARRERRRTNRVLNVGLVAATGLLAVALLWWVVATTVTEIRLAGADRHAAAVTALEDARSAVLQARSNESLVLVARSGGAASDAGFTDQLDRVLGPNGSGGLLGTAAAAAGADGGPAIGAARDAAQRWREAHQRLRQLDDGGHYTDAVASAIGTDPAGSRAGFERVDAALGTAVDAQRAARDADAGAAQGASTGLAAGPAVLALLAAVAAALGIAVRVREYR